MEALELFIIMVQYRCSIFFESLNNCKGLPEVRPEVRLLKREPMKRTFLTDVFSLCNGRTGNVCLFRTPYFLCLERTGNAVSSHNLPCQFSVIFLTGNADLSFFLSLEEEHHARIYSFLCKNKETQQNKVRTLNKS